MKASLFLLLLCAFIGCARHNDDLPPVSGDREPVNSPAIIQEVTAHV
ncbi:hypothetical protein MFFDBJGM_01493 [Pectobacterium versatile]|nr:hypothetical protein MFFDBJGM_01493 [Pectobacterium versatile]